MPFRVKLFLATVFSLLTVQYLMGAALLTAMGGDPKGTFKEVSEDMRDMSSESRVASEPDAYDRYGQPKHSEEERRFDDRPDAFRRYEDRYGGF